jgi:hypothetical protein
VLDGVAVDKEPLDSRSGGRRFRSKLSERCGVRTRIGEWRVLQPALYCITREPFVLAHVDDQSDLAATSACTTLVESAAPH